MEFQQSQQPAHLTTTALLNRQLTDWQNLLADFEALHAPANQIAYCREKIERLKQELKTLES